MLEIREIKSIEILKRTTVTATLKQFLNSESKSLANTSVEYHLSNSLGNESSSMSAMKHSLRTKGMKLKPNSRKRLEGEHENFLV